MVFKSLEQFRDRMKRTDKLSGHMLAVSNQLSDWHQRRSLVWVKPPFGTQSYQSMILGVDAEEKRFFLDEPFSLKGGAARLWGQPLVLHIRESRRKATFRSVCCNEGVQSEAQTVSVMDARHGLLAMEMPRFIAHEQRRRAFRVDLRRWTSGECQLRSSLSQVSVPILDISSLGLCCTVSLEVAECIDEAIGQFEDDLDAQVTVEGLSFNTKLRLRRVSALADGKMQLGFEYEGLAKEQTAKLDRWMFQLQRRRKKYRQNDEGTVETGSLVSHW